MRLQYILNSDGEIGKLKKVNFYIMSVFSKKIKNIFIFILDNIYGLIYICSNMKRKVTVSGVILILFAVGSLLAATYNYFSASSTGDSIILQWQTTSEDNLEKFGIERRTINNQVYTTIDFVSARGYAATYKYEDKNIYKTTDNIYVYRLAFYDKNNPTPVYSNEISVAGKLSDVKSTWGSIKAMFR